MGSSNEINLKTEESTNRMSCIDSIKEQNIEPDERFESLTKVFIPLEIKPTMLYLQDIYFWCENYPL